MNASHTRVLLFIATAVVAAQGCSSDTTSAETDTEIEVDTSADTEATTDSDLDVDEADTALDVAHDTAPLPDYCWTDLAVGESVVFASGFEHNTEGISFGADGGLYVSVVEDGAIFRIDPDGDVTPFAEVPSSIGFALAADDHFIVASFGESRAPAVIDGGVYEVTPEGAVTLLAEGIASPNFVTLLSDGSALVSDDFDTRVWRVTRGGELSVAIDGVDSPNGMALSPDGTTLYVVSTFDAVGSLTAFDVGEDGLPQTPGRVIAEVGASTTPDGMAVGEDGTIYVAANVKSRIVAVNPVSGNVTTVGENMQFPASLAFGRGDGFDPCSLYTTQLFGTEIRRLAVGQAGVPLP